MLTALLCPQLASGSEYACDLPHVSLEDALALHEPGCPKTTCRPGCIRDVEELCGAVLERRRIRRGDSEYDDVLAHLLGEAWIVASQYDPARDRARNKGLEPNMAAYVFATLSRRLHDVKRREFRTRWTSKRYSYERERPTLVELDNDRLDDAQRARAGDPEDVRAPDLARALAGGSRRRARDLAELGLREDKRAA